MKKNTTIILLFFGFVTMIACEKAVLQQPPSSKKDVFEYLWKSIDEKYSFFNLKHIDWDSVYLIYELKISETMSEEAFFDTLSLMIDELRDGHSGINSFNNDHKNVVFFYNSPENFNDRIITDFYFEGYGNRTGPFQHALIRQGNIGYIYYGSFGEDVSDEDMEYLLEYYSDAAGLIIDVRNNFGGAVENVRIRRLKISALHLPVSEIEPAAAGLAAENLVDDAHDGSPAPAADSAVEPEEGRMDEFVLQDEVPGAAAQPVAQFVREIVEEAGPIAPPGQAHHLDPVPPALQGLDQVTVVQEPAGQGVQAAV